MRFQILYLLNASSIPAKRPKKPPIRRSERLDEPAYKNPDSAPAINPTVAYAVVGELTHL